MRDLIWTIIAIWLVYKLVDIFRRSGSKNSGPYQDQTKSSENSAQLNSQKIRTAARRSADREGEYVDYQDLN